MLFAALEAQLGQMSIRQLANARASIEGTVIDGVFDEGLDVATLGDAGMRTSRPSFTCVTADLPPGVDGGTPVEVRVHGRAIAFRVAPQGRVDLLELGQTELDLELP